MENNGVKDSLIEKVSLERSGALWNILGKGIQMKSNTNALR